MVFVCLGIYFLVFLFLRFRANPASRKPPACSMIFRQPLTRPCGHPLPIRWGEGGVRGSSGAVSSTFWPTTNPCLWLACGLFISTVVYAVNYATASQFTLALFLLAGAMLGQGAAVWASWRAEPRRVGRAISWLLVLLIVMLSVASLWCPASVHIFQYRSQARWSGPWDNPNIAGLLMGMGGVLATGCAVLSFKFQVSSRGTTVRRWLALILLVVPTVFMGRGLLHSYSRGAWLSYTWRAGLFGLAMGFPRCARKRTMRHPST